MQPYTGPEVNIWTHLERKNIFVDSESDIAEDTIYVGSNMQGPPQRIFSVFAESHPLWKMLYCPNTYNSTNPGIEFSTYVPKGFSHYINLQYKKTSAGIIFFHCPRSPIY